jgi:hypothetical protein
MADNAYQNLALSYKKKSCLPLLSFHLWFIVSRKAQYDKELVFDIKVTYTAKVGVREYLASILYFVKTRGEIQHNGKDSL